MAQIHELNTFAGTLGAGAYLAIDDGTDTGKISASRFLANTEAEIAQVEADLNGRIDNIIAGGDAPSAAEVTDARRGADGVNYPSLGDAIRGQVSGLDDALSDRLIWTTKQLAEQTKNLITGMIKGANVAAIGRIETDATYDIYYAPVENGKTYCISTSEVFAVGGFFTDIPALNAYTYDSTRFVENSKVITAPIDGYVAFRILKTFAYPQIEEGSTATPYIYPMTAEDKIARAKGNELEEEAVKLGFAEFVSTGAETETDTSIAQCTNTIAGNTIGYTNGAQFGAPVAVTKIILNAYFTATKFSLFVVADDGSLFDAIKNITPTIVNNEFDLPRTLFVPSGYRVYLDSLNGVFAYLNTGVNSLYEFSNGSTLTPSPIRAGFDFAYTDAIVKFLDSVDIENDFDLETGLMLKWKEIDENIGYLGRWFDYEVNGNTYKCTNNQGSELYFKTKGATSVTLTFGQITAQTVTPYIAYSVDGAAFVRTQIGSPITISLTNTTNNPDHIIRVIIDGMTEAQGGNKWSGTLGVYLISVSVNTGELVGLMPRNKIGLFYGDSVTEGINALGVGADASVNSAISAFPWYCCLKMNAVSLRAGYGATGLSQAGSFNTFINTINYLKSGLRVPTYYPDFIVINYGINDISMTESDFKQAYLVAINRLHTLYPDIPIFMVSYFTGNKFDGVMEEIANDDALCYFIPTDGWGGATTDGTHLSDAGAQNNGGKLANEILKIMGKGFFE